MAHGVKKALAIALIAAICALGSFAQGGPSGGGKMGDGMGGAMGSPGDGMSLYGDGLGGGKATVEDVKALVKRIALGDAELNRLRTMLKAHNEEMIKAKADLEVIRAKLTRQLIEKNPDVEAIRKTVRESVEVEYRIRVMQIERNIEMRKLVGEENWALMLRLSAMLNQMVRRGASMSEIEAAFGGDSAKLELVKLVLGLSW